MGPAGREPACVEACFAGALGQRVVDPGDEPDGFARAGSGFVPVEGAGRPAIRFVRGPARPLPAPPSSRGGRGEEARA